MRKTFKFLAIFIISLLLTCSVSFAATQVNKSDATMKLVEDNVCHITFGKYGDFEKKLIKCDTDSKIIDIGLTVTNKSEKLDAKKADVVLLFDCSRSMSTNQITIDGKVTTRKEAVLSSAETLVDKLLSANPNIKIGVVEFATSLETDDDGYTIEGTDKDAKIITDTLSSDKTTIKQALDTVASDTMGARTNLEVGLDAANRLLKTNKDTDTEKYIIVLTDAIPNTAKGVTMDKYTDKTAVPTKNKLLELKAADVNVISMLINMTDDEIQISEEDPKPTYRQVAEKIFGTTSAPTVGSVFYVTDEQVEDTVTKEIYASLVQESYTLKNIVIKDYFPKNIIENFKYAELTKADKGTISASVDKTDNSITWTIKNLDAGEVGTFSYRLTLNDEFTSDIVGINLPTNENVKITYDENEVPGKAENDKCPIVALDVLPKKDIPQTGSKTTLYTIMTFGAIIIIGIGSYIYIKRTRF